MKKTRRALKAMMEDGSGEDDCIEAPLVDQVTSACKQVTQRLGLLDAEAATLCHCAAENIF